MTMANWTLKEYLDRAASGEATPGGGSVAAIAGAMAASMVTMVTNLTIGKKGYLEVEAECRAIRERSRLLGAELQELAEADMRAFESLMAAYRLPRSTETETSARLERIQDALNEAIEVPFRIARACEQVMVLARRLVEIGNRNAVSDAGVACFLGEGAAQSALLNVDINLKAFTDQDLARRAAGERKAIGERVASLRAETSALLVMS
ncbi:cyclodeaminase/cyclohydrolase family protein [Desulforudis sp. 1088]|uniref:cyclodeaminase/cyclohydrolase family protein n=1 Tax=unclassified Candidatus Desulforudis TaxID=2635950 RepID=UPI003CE56918